MLRDVFDPEGCRGFFQVLIESPPGHLGDERVRRDDQRQEQNSNDRGVPESKANANRFDHAGKLRFGSASM